MKVICDHRNRSYDGGGGGGSSDDGDVGNDLAQVVPEGDVNNTRHDRPASSAEGIVAHLHVTLLTASLIYVTLVDPRR